MAKFKVGDRVRVLRHRAFKGNDVSDSSGLVGKIVTLGNSHYDMTTDEFTTFSTDALGWLVRSDDIELVVAPATTTAIRTVTRREIVPGVYGTMGVGRTDGHYVSVGFIGAMDDYVGLNSSDLRAAAALFTELADVLDEQKEAAVADGNSGMKEAA